VSQPENYRMIAISGILNRLYANLLRSIIQDWCIQHNKIPDTQYVFYQGRSTLPLQLLFILRHLACCTENAKWVITVVCCVCWLQTSLKLYLRNKLWGHLRSCQMPDHILSILEDLYHADEYTLLDGDKATSVQPSFSVKQRCPLSPLLFAIYFKDIDSICRRGERHAHWHSKFSGDPHAVCWWPFPHVQWPWPYRPCRTKYEHTHEDVSLSIHKSLRWCASTLTPAICPLSSTMVRSSPQQTPSNIWEWFLTHQFEYCSWCGATSIYSWYFPHQTVHMGTWSY